MVISLKRFKLPLICILSLAIVLVLMWVITEDTTIQPVMGGYIHANDKAGQEDIQPVFYDEHENTDSERFQRPSKQSVLKLKYSAKYFISNSEQLPPYIKTVFQTPEDVIQAYYAILQDASNMAGYYGGCGTVGWSKIPYPYAYELLTKETREKIALKEFEESFAGVGHITLLKLHPAYQPHNTSANIKYYMVEIEVITGLPYKEGDNKAQPGYFAYYYGLIFVEEIPSEGWKIKSIYYVPEDFLCHPMHHWDYDARALTEIVYKNWYGLINDIEKVEKDDSLIHVHAIGKGNKYRFDFVRLTNGDDVLLHENVQQNGQWREVNLLKEEDQSYKFSILNLNLNRWK